MAIGTDKKKNAVSKDKPRAPFSALNDSESFWGPGFLRKVGRTLSASDATRREERAQTEVALEGVRPRRKQRDREIAATLPSGRSTDTAAENVDAVQQDVAILNNPNSNASDRRAAARALSENSYDVLSAAASASGTDVQSLLASMDRIQPKSMNRVLLNRKGLPMTGDIDRPTDRETLVAEVRDIVNRPTVRVAADAPAPPPAASAPEASPRPQPKIGPGGKVAGTQEDFEAFRAQNAVDKAMAERNRQAKIKFLRSGGRYAADGFGTVVGGQQVSLDRPDGQRLAVLPGRGKTPSEKRSGAYAYADELRDQARLAENTRTRERQEKFVANLGEPGTELGRKREIANIRRAEAEEFLTNIKRAARGADKTAREIARGYDQGQYGRRGSTDYSGAAADFFAEADQLGSVRAQLQGKDQEAQIKWARKQLDAREETRRDQARKEEERRRNMAQSSYQDLVDKYRNPSSSSFSTVNFGI